MFDLLYFIYIRDEGSWGRKRDGTQPVSYKSKARFGGGGLCNAIQHWKKEKKRRKMTSAGQADLAGGGVKVEQHWWDSDYEVEDSKGGSVARERERKEAKSIARVWELLESTRKDTKEGGVNAEVDVNAVNKGMVNKKCVEAPMLSKVASKKVVGTKAAMATSAASKQVVKGFGKKHKMKEFYDIELKKAPKLPKTEKGGECGTKENGEHENVL